MGVNHFLLKRSSRLGARYFSSAGSSASDAPPSNDMSSSSTDSCASPDLMEGSSYGHILKTGRGAVFIHACSFLSIWRDLLAMVIVSSYLPFALV